MPLLIVLVLALIGWVFYPPMKIQYQESREQMRLEAELESLKERNDALSAQVQRLQTPEGVEEVARESLGLVKPGENLYLLIDPDEETSTPLPASPDEEVVQESLWYGLLDLVFGVR